MSRLQWFAEEQAAYDQEAPYFVKQRAKALLAEFRGFRGKKCDLETLKAIDKIVAGKIGNTIARQILRDELKTLINSVLTPEKTLWMACAIAGGYYDAAKAIPIGAFSNDREAVDCLGRIEQVDLDGIELHETMKIHILLCNSVFAGTRLKADLYLKSFGRWSQLFHLTRSRSKVRCPAPRAMIGAELIARVERVAGEVNLIGVTVNKNISEKNFKLSKSRSRDHEECPYGATYECVECEVGRNQCLRSCFLVDTEYQLIEVKTEYHEGRDTIH